MGLLIRNFTKNRLNICSSNKLVSDNFCRDDEPIFNER